MKKVGKFFNTAGPMIEEMHYLIPSLTRLDLEEIEMLIMQKKYFLLHAPRQSGKTSIMLALQAHINKDDDEYFALYVNVEPAQVARHDFETGIKTIVLEIASEIENLINDKDIKKEFLSIYSECGGQSGLKHCLTHLSKKYNKKIVLFIDEIDSLIGDTLISVLRQLRAGYKSRETGIFPVSVILCGLVDIKDYKIHKSDGEIITGGSCFNIKSESLTLGNFSKDEIKTLYLEHTKETGQVFESAVFDLIYEYTGGQPWLVNALAYQVCFKMKENRDRTIAITAEMFKKAKEDLILSRQTHLDQLADKLDEPRVRSVIEPMILGTDSSASEDDKIYCKDLGLIKKTKQGHIISNSIYKEVIPRELTNGIQDSFLSMYKNPKCVNEDETIDNDKLIELFVEFWRENSDVWKNSLSGYVEAAPHLIFQGFLQRVANGHGTINREYALGNGRVDLYLEWDSPIKKQNIIIELKIRNEKQNTSESLNEIKTKALEQTAEYADKCNADNANILIFDRRKNIKWEEKCFTEIKEYGGQKIKIWGL